jgi:hypothetical protein
MLADTHGVREQRTNQLRAKTKGGSATTDEVTLADIDPVMSKNGVRGRDMEKHVGNRPALHEVESLEVEELVRAGRDADVAVF